MGTHQVMGHLHALVALTALFFGWTSATSATASTLSDIQKSGVLNCSTAGHLNTAKDYEKPGTIAGFDRDFCRAIAAAVLQNDAKINFVQLIPHNRFQALQEGAVDVLARSTTWTLSRDANLGLHFAATNFYDGQGFVAPKSLGISNLAMLKARGLTARACVEKRTTSEDNIADYIRDHGLPITLKRMASFEEVRYAFLTGECDLFSADRSFLVEFRLKETEIPDNYILLEDVISKEPLGVVVRDDDAEWFNIVRWAVFATIQAEELGITSVNVDWLRTAGNSAQRRFLGGEPGIGEPLGLDDAWAYRIVKAVGNYGEIFERNLGAQTDFKMDRGLNKLWTQGGLLYAPPFR